MLACTHIDQWRWKESIVEFASWVKRAAAVAVDYILILVPGFAGLLVGGVAGSTDTANALGGLGFGLGFVGLLYSRWIRGGSKGQSWGRSLLKIRLVDMRSGKPLGIGKAVLRDVCHLFDYFLLF